MLLRVRDLGQLVRRKQSSVVSESMLRIISQLLECYGHDLAHLDAYNSVIESVRTNTYGILNKYFKTDRLIVKNNMGSSMAVKACLDLHIDLLYRFQSQSQELVTINYCEFLTILTSNLEREG